MTDGRLLTGFRPGVRRGLCVAMRRQLGLRMRRHVDFCRTSAALCRA
ncbi:hypothetical protein GCM10009836_61940 [Pseudonocardia ailaonensis]|uniref:Uncharacterized protein n=1 Tax=Pseudonocardia ailaonensis TaxID=367279 RepID=A0ABN2NK57_9PSEU